MEETLRQYLFEHTESCTDAGEANFADMVFFLVKSCENKKGEKPNAEKLKELIANHQPEFGDAIDFFDGNEHNYLSIGGWIGDQGLALKLMGLGAILGLWQLLTPLSMLGLDRKDPEMMSYAMKFAERGMVTIQYVKAKDASL